MSLASGTSIGSYEILDAIGAGGMGEVYRARDKKLGRDVALKVLPDIFARDHDRMSRFTREAQLLASLNHPNIAAIYGVEESGERLALVLELVEGPTLAERISKGPIRIEEALKIALQIAEALEAAHEKSVIHRDLKPANVKFTSQGTVKVLDFGLAKALEDESGVSPALSQSPTLISIAATGAGIILGTAGYMAPEQARGKPADRRADIWAFGVILFEMLTAQRVFEGETVSDTLAKILEREPDWKQLPPNTPLAVRKLLQRCLTKNSKDRLQAIGDARTLIQELIADPAAFAGEAAPAVYPLWKRVLPWALAPLFLAAGWLLKPSGNPPARSVSRFEYSLPEGQQLNHQFRHAVALSPDGKRMAFVAVPAAAAGSSLLFATPPATATRPSIYVKSLDQWDAVPVPGTENSFNPFFSPDGQWLGFVQRVPPATAGGAAYFTVKKVPLAGGAPVVLVDKVKLPIGFSWGANGTIVFAPDLAGGLKTVSDAGGESQEFTQLDTGASEASHRLPSFLPDGSGVLFTVVRYGTNNVDWKRAQIWVKSLKDGQRKLLMENAADARLVGNRYLVFAREGKLFGARFDLRTLAIVGSAFPVIDGVTQATSNSVLDTQTGAAQFSVSGDGSLLFAPGSIEPPVLFSLVWVDRKGMVRPVRIKPGPISWPRVSTDGNRIIFSESYVEKDIWVFDTVRETQDRLTSDGESRFGIPSPDGSRIALASNRSGTTRVYLKPMNSTEFSPLTEGPYDLPESWTPDGKELAFVRGDPETGSSGFRIWVVPVDQPKKARMLLNTRFNETHPEFSPDGRWLAYLSDESGRRELYVQPYPGPGRRTLVSSDLAGDPAWSKDGKELLYFAFTEQTQKMMSVHFKVSGGEFLPEKPVVLFEGKFQLGATTRQFDVTSDGRFLMIQRLAEDLVERNKKIFPSTLRIVLNWTAELDRLLAH